MPTLFRLLSVIGVAVGLAYAAMFAVTVLVRPEPREIVQTVALPQEVSADMHTGRSAAEMLNSQAHSLAHHSRREHRDR